MRDSSMFYFNISINHCAGCKYSPHPWLALGARRNAFENIGQHDAGQAATDNPQRPC